MDNSLYTLLSGQVALRRKLDVVANNMANLGTTGFKSERVHFDDVYKKLETDGRGVAFVSDIATSTDFTQGSLQQTGNDLDVGISGKGVISAQDSTGKPFYTRDGRMSRTSEGNLVLTSNGMNIVDAAGAAIQIPPNVQKISIAGDGTISSSDGGTLGKIGIYDFDYNKMDRLADGLFTSKDKKQPELSTVSRLNQGFIESSNVNSVKTLTDLINVQRAYETGSNLMEKENQRIQDAISRLGRTPR
jgi:flagellar basal-body rod protein FlgF